MEFVKITLDNLYKNNDHYLLINAADPNILAHSAYDVRNSYIFIVR